MLGGCVTILFLLFIFVYGLVIVTVDLTEEVVSADLFTNDISHTEGYGRREHNPHYKSKFIEGIGMVQDYDFYDLGGFEQYSIYEELDPRFGTFKLEYMDSKNIEDSQWRELFAHPLEQVPCDLMYEDYWKQSLLTEK